MSYRRTGRRPGRPRYPGLLTPAEERVLEGVRQGLTNAQIADVLGLAPDTVKYHVANMLSKLYLDDRRELAAWQPDAEKRQQLLVAPTTIRGLLRPAPQLAGPALLGGLAVVLAVMAVLAVRSEAPLVRETTSAPTAPAQTLASAPLHLSPLTIVHPMATSGRRPQFIHDLAGGVTLGVGSGLAPAWRPGIDVAALALGGNLALFHARWKRWQVADLPAPVQAAWSPDGDALAFTAKGRRHLYVVDFAAGVVRRMANGGRLALPPAPWSLDGKEVALVAGEDVLAWNVVTHAWRTLAGSGARFLGWDANGTAWLAVGGESEVLRAVDARGVVSDTPVPAALDGSSAVLAPGGRLIAYRLLAPSTTVAVLEPAGLRRVGEFAAAGVLRWSPDGGRIAVYPTSCRSGAGLREYDVASGRTSLVSNLNGAPAWSNDVRWLAFGRGPGLLFVVGEGGGASRHRLDLPGGRGFTVTGWSESGRFLAVSSGTGLRGHCAIDSPSNGTSGL